MEALWREYEAASSPEALLVKDFDKLEMIMQVSNSTWVLVLLFWRVTRAVLLKDFDKLEMIMQASSSTGDLPALGLSGHGLGGRPRGQLL